MNTLKKRKSEPVSTLFAKRLAQLRRKQEYSMQNLADRAQVSKSMISKTERGDVQPSLDVAVRLATALGTTLSDMLRHDEYSRVIKMTPSEQSKMMDAASGTERRILSPVFDQTSLEILRTQIPPRGNPGIYPPHKLGTQEYIIVLSGRLLVSINGETYKLGPGDSFFFEAHFPHSIENPGTRKADIIVIIRH